MSILIVHRANAESLDGGVPGANTTITIDKPNNVSNGDLLVACLGTTDDNGYTAPTGWTLIRRVDTSNQQDRGVHMYYKLITDAGSEPTSYTFTQSGNEYQQGCIYNLRGVYGSDPIDTTSYAIDTNMDDHLQLPSLTTTYNNALVIDLGLLAASRTVPLSEGAWIMDGGGRTIDMDLGANWEQSTPGGSYTVFVHTFTGHKQIPTAGSTLIGNWKRGGYDSNVDALGVTVAFNSYDDYPVTPCGCNAICNGDCAVNQLCTGHSPACSNDFTFTTISANDIILASHMLELQTAINSEINDSGRRFNANEPDYCDSHTPGDLACTNNEFDDYSWTSGVEVDGIIQAQHPNDIKDANNEITNNSGSGVLITTSFLAQSADAVNSVILASDITDLQTKINQTRNICICDSHCNCDPADCGCDGECPSDEYYYP